jgi:hypothetical protein
VYLLYVSNVYQSLNEIATLFWVEIEEKALKNIDFSSIGCFGRLWYILVDVTLFFFVRFPR